ncbi:uncharacterized protein PHALS_07178 [Plasmopara halstedii]|uniref:Secreted RxLR effector protein RXLR-C04 n=1 Tax=Plasmopara halstedii TaxID=4781 RepID=RLR04_PLAHL|nr:uncharacterized protein PHALS_07178 [Plasmopara halstedii]A0A0P1B6Y2.1 RecName: Full=Secreted RxLR effector protein RXLR-C04; Flags: Precursor [Plasmopara halstedii]CEG49414.1 hypothetical protein PHALS_07178 [Plasmopara halstedii]|eukprot:XP_024585783.1 hypothetical protein PHALS_07178 [Plasmopara halstedii]
MRLSYIFVVVATIITNCDIASASLRAIMSDTASGNGLGTRILRQTNDSDDLEPIRHAMLDMELLEKIAKDPKYAEEVFGNWRHNGQTKAEMENRLQSNGLLGKYRFIIDRYAEHLANSE